MLHGAQLKELASRVLEHVLDDPPIQKFLDEQTEVFLGRPMHKDRDDDESWWACRTMIANLLLLEAIRTGN